MRTVLYSPAEVRTIGNFADDVVNGVVEELIRVAGHSMLATESEIHVIAKHAASLAIQRFASGAMEVELEGYLDV